ncbi:protein EFR3 homolog B-like isoform X2 [Liolophura sinensis]|uniref:protein EFR3 homolog B-like isoform X2 n=1 Tax=Liolophura sinensis TaxID=3198878 RepID=UPI00315871D4
MAGCCGCCSAMKPRYKRLVDNIFPVNPQDGLVKSNMEKLTFYALSSPEKLDRIGDYMAQKLIRSLARRRLGVVFIAMEALDQLLVACHAQTINLFVESFLKMVQKLLECDEPDLQCLATASFIKFANIEEDTPSYHRRYDFFVSKFSSMCHNGLSNKDDRRRVRTSGLRGLQGVVRKTVSDDLQVNIWDSMHMDKIVPSLLYNMHDPSFGTVDPESPKDEDHPSYVAETVFRDLICRASYGNIKPLLKPILMHFDNHSLWVPNNFAVKIFTIIMFSVQPQYGHLVIQSIMSHLDTHAKSDSNIKISIVEVLYETVLIAAGGSVGPSVLEVFNTLLRHLRISVDSPGSDNSPTERRFQESVINTIGEFANNLPDYQKIEIMMFVMSKMPQSTEEDMEGGQMDVQLQTTLLKTLLKVATKYKTVLMSNAFPSELLRPLLRMSLASDPGMRLIVQDILHTLIDRHNNTAKLTTVRIPKDISQLGLTVDKCSRQDIMFMKRVGTSFYAHLYENMEKESNRLENYKALYCTMALISIEMGEEDILVELLRLALDIQDLAVSSQHLTVAYRCAIHAMVAAYLNLISQLTSIPALYQCTAQVIETRQEEATHLLPEFAFKEFDITDSMEYPSLDNLDPSYLFEQSAISEALDSSGYDISKLNTPFSEKVDFMDIDITFPQLERSSSTSSCSSLESLFTMERQTLSDEITFDSLKKMLAEDSHDHKEEARKRMEILNVFKKAPFEEIVARSEAKSNLFHNKLNEILDNISTGTDSPDSGIRVNGRDPVPVFQMQFPDLFVY